jgi:hypothetical protein
MITPLVVAAQHHGKKVCSKRSEVQQEIDDTDQVLTQNLGTA